MKNIVIVFNPLVGYLKEQGTSFLGEDTAERTKVRILSYLKEVDRDSTEIFFTREIRSTEDTFFSTQRSGFLVGSEDVQIVESFKYFSKKIFNTLRPNALFKTPLLSEIKKANPHKIILVGVEMSSSILFTAMELKCLGFEVEILEPLTASSSQYLHAAAISIGSAGGLNFVRG